MDDRLWLNAYDMEKKTFLYIPNGIVIPLGFL